MRNKMDTKDKVIAALSVVGLLMIIGFVIYMTSIPQKVVKVPVTVVKKVPVEKIVKVPVPAKPAPKPAPVPEDLTVNQQDEVASFTTKFDSSQTTRVHNIELVASKLSGYVVQPGQIFSFNDVVGDRTVAAGYQLAPILVQGEFDQGVGGGVCQVSSTLFNTALISGLEVPERHAHSAYLDRYPLGRDAAVNYGYKDLKFKNNTQSPIMIQVSVAQNSVTVGFYGQKLNRNVVLNTTEAPKDGKRHVVLQRTVNGNGVVLFRDSFTSDYKE